MRESLRQTGDCNRAFRAVRQLEACGLVLRRIDIRQSFNRFSSRGVSACVSFRRRFAPFRTAAKVSLPPTRMNGVFLSGSRFFGARIPFRVRAHSAFKPHSAAVLRGAKKFFGKSKKKTCIRINNGIIVPSLFLTSKQQTKIGRKKYETSSMPDMRLCDGRKQRSRILPAVQSPQG